MSEKRYEKYGYSVKYKDFILVYNMPLTGNYDWYISTNPAERHEAIGIRRKDGNSTKQCVSSLNYIRGMYNLY